MLELVRHRHHFLSASCGQLLRLIAHHSTILAGHLCSSPLCIHSQTLAHEWYLTFFMESKAWWVIEWMDDYVILATWWKLWLKGYSTKVGGWPTCSHHTVWQGASKSQSVYVLKLPPTHTVLIYPLALWGACKECLNDPGWWSAVLKSMYL